MNVLLIGGPRSGDRIDIPDSCRSLIVSVKGTHTYLRRMLSVPTRINGCEDRRRVFYFAHEGLDDDDAFICLLDFIDERR